VNALAMIAEVRAKIRRLLACVPVSAKGAILGRVRVRKPDLSETTVEITLSREFTKPRLPDAPSQAYLVVIAGGRLGQHAVLSEQPLDIGRGSNCALQLDVDSVSRQHARVFWNGEHHEAVDLESTNGTYVNEVRIRSRHLLDGDRLQVGKVILKYIAAANLEAAYYEEMERLVHHDGLTGVANRSAFDQAAAAALTKARTAPMAVSLIVMDLDHFKRVNDSLGHAAGDAVLRQVAAVVSDEVSGSRLFARTGGEEFAVLLPGEDRRAAVALAQQIRVAVERADVFFEGRRIQVTVSLGVAERARGSVDPMSVLYETADERLYEAKAAGRNCVR
jgi:diguanylate cyclase (GGDEF)-like protein